MNLLLQSSNFIRYSGSLARNLVLNKSSAISYGVLKHKNVGKNLLRALSSVAAPSEAGNNSVDRWIRKLDFEAKRTGRVSLKELQEVFDEIRFSKQATTTQSLMMIRCCGNLLPDELPENKIRLVNDMMKTLEEQGIQMDISHYNTLLLVYLENEHHFSPTEFLSNIEKKGIEPNRVTFQRLIAAYCYHGDIEGATQILEFMKEKQLPISESVFNSLIIGHSQSNDMDSAVGTLGVMKQANIKPSADTYTSLLCGYAKKGNINGMKEMFELAEKEGIELLDKHLLDIIYSLAINNHITTIDMITPRLQKSFGYNQDAKNTILKLVAKGEDKAALIVLRTMVPIQFDNDEVAPVGTFLIRQLVKANRPYETIVNICEELIATKENEKALLFATEASLINEKPNLSLKLLSRTAETEGVSQHYYWPVLVQFGKANDKGGIIRTLKQMIMDTNLPVSNETLREYVIEYLGSNDRAIQTLRQAGISVASAASASVAYHLQNNDLLAAKRIAMQYRANYNLVTIRRGIVQAYKQKPDVEAIAALVRCLIESVEVENEEKEVDPAGSVLLSIQQVKPLKSSEIISLLQSYLNFGLRLSQSAAVIFQEKIGSELTPEISNLLDKLTSPDIHPIDLNRPGDISIAIKNFANKDQLSPEGLETLLDSCILNEKLNESLEVYSDLVNKHSSFKIKEVVLVRLAALLVKEGKNDDALKIFENHKLPSPITDKSFNYTSICWKLLNLSADTKDPILVDKLFNVMKSNNFITPINILLGPLIKVHILRDDLKTALDKFEECCTLYRATPWKNEIACKLIQSEDAASLQRLTDLSTQIHGEVNSLYDLVLSFVECGRIRQARKILETPGLRMKHTRLNSACVRYKNEGHVGHLENLVEATKDLQFIDRAEIYYHLLGTYSASNEVDKAFGLWTQMQEEDVQPTDFFLVKLAELLKKHNRPVPFAVPEEVMTERVSRLKTEMKDFSNSKALRRAIFSKDVDAALQIKQRLSDNEIPLGDKSGLLTLLINSGRVGEASKILIQWLEQGLRPTIKTVSFVMNSVAKIGDINTLTLIGNYLDEDMKRFTSYINRLTHCMVEAGLENKVLENFKEEIENANTPEEIAQLRNMFPKGGAFSLFHKTPELIPQFEELAVKYREKGILELDNILWVHFFLQEDKEKSNTYWEKIKGYDKLLFQPILKKARAERNLESVKVLASLCKESNLNTPSLGAIYSSMLDILAFENKPEECDKQLAEILNGHPIEHLNINSILRVKKCIENAGLVYKHPIPPKKSRGAAQSSSSSSSDSDEEEEVKLKKS